MPEVWSDGVVIHCEVEGEGPPLVMHTGAGGDLEMWRQVAYMEGLTGMRIVLMDHRGHGRSGRPKELSAHRIDRYVADVVTVADALALERFSFLGYSDGGAVGYALAAHAPDRVAALIGLGAVGGPDEAPDRRRELAASVRHHGMSVLVDELQRVEGPLPEWFEEQMLRTDPEMFALELEGWSDWEGPWSAFDQIGAPTLIVVGELEEGPGREAVANAEAAAAAIPRARAVSSSPAPATSRRSHAATSSFHKSGRSCAKRSSEPSPQARPW